MKGTSFQLLSQLARGLWAIDAGFADEMMPTVARILNHEPVSFYDTSAEENAEMTLPAFAYREGSGRITTIRDVFETDLPENSVLVMNQRGAVMKEDYCGIMGTESKGIYLGQAMNSPKIVAAVMDVDSPGGAVNGTLEFTNRLYSATKPVIGYANGLAASAGYMILCGASEIYASSNTAILGSVGILTELRDYSEQLAKYGVKRVVVTASTSTDKTTDHNEALNGNPEPMQRMYLDPLHAAFKAAVRRTRPDISEEYLTGKIYLAEAALAGDMIDGIMAMDDVVERALELGMLMNKQAKSIQYHV